jgi:tetratricopeptide (TPR) repeat protein
VPDDASRREVHRILAELARLPHGPDHAAQRIELAGRGLDLVDADSGRDEWAGLNHHLGAGLAVCPHGDRGDNLARAIKCYEAAQDVFTRERAPRVWATVRNNLAMAYHNLPAGDRGENLERAIGYYRDALRVWTHQGYPLLWAGAQNNLANAYSNLPTGDQTQNLQHAIDGYECALRVWTRDAAPREWASALANLSRTLVLAGHADDARSRLAEALQAGPDPAEEAGLRQALNDLDPGIRRQEPGAGEAATGAGRAPVEVSDPADGWTRDFERLMAEKRNQERRIQEALRREPTSGPVPDQYAGQLHILREWGSYTPIPFVRSADGNAVCGGYFVQWRERGIVVDPGLGFAEAFMDARYTFRNIDAVVATHDHVDHTHDLQCIATCLWELGDPDSADSPPHEIAFYLAPGVGNVHALNLWSARRNGRPARPQAVQTLDPAGDWLHVCTCGQPWAQVRGTPAHHRDMSGRDNVACGALVKLLGGCADPTSSCLVGFTGDTAYSADLADAYAEVDLLVAHIGSIYPCDKNMTGDHPDNHLGVMGLRDLLADLASRWRERGKTPLVLISEWGEELKRARRLICESLPGRVALRIAERECTDPVSSGQWPSLPMSVWPAAFRQRVALRPGGAEPLCARCRAAEPAVATHWVVADAASHDIVYLCDAHLAEHQESVRFAHGLPSQHAP